MLYSPLKVFHHRDRIDALRRGEQPDPAQVQIIITNRCNHRCEFCSYRLPGYSSSQMFDASDEIPYAKVLEILEDCRAMGVGAIQITGGGEPTIHPQFRQIAEAIIDGGFELGLVTNGSAIRVEELPLLARAAWVRFSVDAGTPETYGSIRQVGSGAFARVWSTVRGLAKAKQLAKSDVVIGIGFVVTRSNFTEVVRATELAREAGADNIRISAVFQPEGADYFENIHPEAFSLCHEAKAMETETFAVFNNFDHRFEDLELAQPHYIDCGIQHFNTYIGADLNVYRCCVQAYNRRGLIGSIKDRRFVELWRSTEKRHDFKVFDARGCDWCMFNEKNRTIAYALNDNPPHVNFV